MKSLKKKTFRLTTLGILGLSTIVGATFPAQAAPNGALSGAPHNNQRNGQRNGQHRRGQWEGLNLSTEQKAQLKTIMQGQRASVQSVKGDTTLSPDEKKAQLKAIRADTQARVNAVLTPEQQAKWKAMHRNYKREGLKELSLSDAQKAQIKAIHQNAKAQIAEVKNHMSLDEAKQREQIRAVRRDSMQRVNALLTPEQQAKLAQMRHDRRADKREHKQHGAPQNNGGLNG